MTSLAFLGLGAMGSRMATALLKAGYPVTVWNRTKEAAQALASGSGATPAETPRQAAADAHIVFSMVRDDAASEAVWLDPQNGALAGLAEGAVGVECSTVSVAHARALATTFAARGRDFLAAPVAGSRPQADAAQLIFLVGGPADVLDRVRPVIETMGCSIQHAGDDPGASTTVKLMVNSLLGVQLATLAELFGFAEREGLDPARALDIIAATPVCSPVTKLMGGMMAAGRFQPLFPIDLVAKDFRLIADCAAAVQTAAPVNAAAKAVYEHAIAAGHGEENITSVVQLYHDKR